MNELNSVTPWDDTLSIRYQEEMDQARQDDLPFDRLFDPDLPDADRRRMFDWYGRMQVEIRQPLAHAIPNAIVVHVIGLFTPIVEIGAGRVAGIGLVSYVSDDIETAVRRHWDATLFLCWPDQSGMASRALRAYTGSTVLYIGEGLGRTLHGERPVLPAHDRVSVFRRFLTDWRCGLPSVSEP